MGTRYEPELGALEFRELGERRAAQVRAAAQSAWQLFLTAHANQIIPAYPSVDPFRGDRSGVIGKLVVLPPIAPRDWLVHVDSTFLASSDGQFWYFTPLKSAATRAVFDASYRYRRLVSADIDESIAFVGLVLPDPMMMTSRGRSVAGLEFEPAAALMGDAMFVDLSDPTKLFAGEAELKDPGSTVPVDDASPRAVMEALVTALKAGDEETWKALFADWYLVPGDGPPLYYAFYPYPAASVDEDWIRSRRLINGDLYDVRAVWVGDPRTVLRAAEFPGAPQLDQVTTIRRTEP
jgi:hypothetical protein